jgi:FixJ family two-component response regulator
MAAINRAYASFYDVDWDFVGDDVDDIESSIARLTDRETEVLDRIAEGESSREIGAELGISTKTVEAHRARINDKMRADDLPHLIRMVFILREEKTN